MTTKLYDKGEIIMKIENYVRAIAGSAVLITLAFGALFSPYWFLFTAFVGINLLQSAFTGFCPAEIILEKVFKIPR